MSDHAEADPTAAGDHPDRGFTHVALQVSDLDASLAFYERYAELMHRTGQARLLSTALKCAMRFGRERLMSCLARLK